MNYAKPGLAGDTAMNIICAYPVNIDAVYNMREEEISQFTQSGPAPKIKSELKRSIGSRDDLISSLLFCMQQGSGAELLIGSQALAEERPPRPANRAAAAPGSAACSTTWTSRPKPTPHCCPNCPNGMKKKNSPRKKKCWASI